MRNELFWIPAIVLLGLFFAGGVYSQVMPPGPPEANPLVGTSIQNGLGYISSSPHLDSEILVLHLLGQTHPEYGLTERVMNKASELDEFNAPIRDFIRGRTIETSSYLSKTLEGPYYPDFIHYFKCEPLTFEWVDSLRSLSDDGTVYGGYNDTHALMILQLVKQDYFGGRCGDNPEYSSQVDSIISEKVSQIFSKLDDRQNLDLWIEKVAVLAFAGQTIPEEHIQFILSQQSPDGGWRGAEYYPLEDTNPHTTALALWALSEANS